MIKLTPIQKAPLKNSIIYGQKIAGMQPIPLNLDSFVKLDNDIAQKPKEIVTAIKDMVANYAKHENISINFKKTVMMDEKHLVGCSSENAIREITKNSVNIEVNPLHNKLTGQPNAIRATLNSEDFSENARTIYTKLHELTQRLKAK